MLRKGEGRVTYEEMGQNFYYYKSKKGDILDGQKSGAYIFRPDGDAIPITDNVELESFSGEKNLTINRAERISSHKMKIFSRKIFLYETNIFRLHQMNC